MDGALLDTNILVDWLRWHRSSRPKTDERRFNSQSAKELIEDFIINDKDIFISCHTLKELLQYPNISEQEESRINTLLPQFAKVLSTTPEVARTAGYLFRRSVEYREHNIEDCYIAATAITYKLPLYTRNPGDFKYVPHPDLEIVIPYQYQPEKAY